MLLPILIGPRRLHNIAFLSVSAGYSQRYSQVRLEWNLSGLRVQAPGSEFRAPGPRFLDPNATLLLPPLVRLPLGPRLQVPAGVFRPTSTLFSTKLGPLSSVFVHRQENGAFLLYSRAILFRCGPLHLNNANGVCTTTAPGILSGYLATSL